MKTFTYSQYIKCIHTFRLNAVMQLAEEITEYKLENTKEKYLQDNLLKNILQDKSEVANFINEFIEPREKIREKDLVNYTTNNYITKRYREKEADFIYKLKNKEMFFLLECQSTVNNKVNYRMLNYCLDIMREWTKHKKEKKITGYPIIVPILLYTGKSKWKNLREENDNYGRNYDLGANSPSFEYNFVEMNKFSKSLLLEKGSMFSYAMLLQKSEGAEELLQDLETIIASTEDKRKLMELFTVIKASLNSNIKQELQDRILKKIEEKIVM